MIDTLVDEPIECITPRGIKTAKQEHEFDILIYATGFDGVTGAYDRIDIRGENGLRLKDAWAETPRTYLGMLAEGFPNMLMVLGPHTARGNSTTTRMWRLGPKKWTSGRGS
jgi:cation diffusion facilitator CzcD-associated flavoprotein CzcO